ncbi:bacteriohemerythrin [Methyloterricola oryzae]|uniref:bacteriohemerythrin n=1 Tax=Methyloterricola oryzae TaxID=1495050 RepID=UPI00069B3A8D|nr:bacteriohemerythrin [Methyloterricola oryzae]
MDLIAWNERYRTGIDIVDRQHQGLFQLLNEYATSLTRVDANPVDEPKRVLDRLIDYAVVHFRTEESLMGEAGVDARHVDMHARSHQAFSEYLGALKGQTHGDEFSRAEDLIRFLVNWLTSHVLGEDQAMGRQLQDIAKGQCPADAYAALSDPGETPAQLALTTSLSELFGQLLQQYRQLHAANQRLLQLQQELSRTERQYRNFIESTSDGVWMIDAEGFTRYVNPRMATMLGYTPEEMVGVHLLDFAHQRDREMVMEKLKARQAGFSEQHDFCFRRKDGSDLWTIVTTNPLFEQNDSYAGALGVITDISARREAEQALIESERTYRSVLASTKDGFILCDTDGRILEVNDAYCQNSGYIRDELLAMTIFDLEASESHTETSRHQQLIAERGEDLFESLHRRKDGSVWPVELSITFWPEAGGRFYAFARDVFSRKRSEFLTRFRADLAQRALTASLDGLMQWVLDNVEIYTGSQIGFFHFVDPDQENLTLQAWSSNTVKNMCKAEGKGQHYPVSQAGVWADCLRQRRAVVHDDYASLPHRKGLPEGHAPVIRQLTVPVLNGALVTAILGVGNKREPYSQDDIEIAQELASMAMDIVEKKRNDERLHQAAVLFANTQEGLIITDADQHIIMVNQAFQKITGYEEKQVLGKTPRLLKSGRHGPDFYRSMWNQIQEQGFWSGEIWNRRAGGAVYPEWLTINAVKDSSGKVSHYVSAFSDITFLKEDEARILHLAMYDPLTELPNRRLLTDRLSQALAATSRTDAHGAVMFIDLDNFKALNDTMGHEAGDQLLIEVAQRLQACARKTDTVARLGGDEFVLMLKTLSADEMQAVAQAQTIAEKVLARINQPVSLGEKEVVISPSIGICLFPAQAQTVEDLLKRADLAMYRAKESGRNTFYFFEPVMQAAAERRVRLEAELRRAIAKTEFVLHYQPQVNRELRIVAAEALLRWAHPQRGLVPPAEFLSVAEEAALILPLGRHVLESACLQLRQWQATPGADSLSLAVNVSVRQFLDKTFVHDVRHALNVTGADPGKLILELTENLLIHDAREARDKMRTLQELGITFSIDDFGTGYSSLRYLNELPFSQLKIDRSFVANVLQNGKDAVLVKTIISMGRQLNLSILAEGVENQDQAAFLFAQECDAFQGYYFGYPVPAEELIAPVLR